MYSKVKKYGLDTCLELTRATHCLSTVCKTRVFSLRKPCFWSVKCRILEGENGVFAKPSQWYCPTVWIFAHLRFCKTDFTKLRFLRINNKLI